MSALLLVAIDVGCPAAALSAVVSLFQNGWTYLVGAGLTSVLIPPLLILAMRSTADADQQTLLDFVQDAIATSAPR